jgi:hypothetical protein
MHLVYYTTVRRANVAIALLFGLFGLFGLLFCSYHLC